MRKGNAAGLGRLLLISFRGGAAAAAAMESAPNPFSLGRHTKGVSGEAVCHADLVMLLLINASSRAVNVIATFLSMLGRCSGLKAAHMSSCSADFPLTASSASDRSLVVLLLHLLKICLHFLEPWLFFFEERSKPAPKLILGFIVDFLVNHVIELAVQFAHYVLSLLCKPAACSLRSWTEHLRELCAHPSERRAGTLQLELADILRRRPDVLTRVLLAFIVGLCHCSGEQNSTIDETVNSPKLFLELRFVISARLSDPVHLGFENLLDTVHRKDDCSRMVPYVTLHPLEQAEQTFLESYRKFFLLELLIPALLRNDGCPVIAISAYKGATFTTTFSLKSKPFHENRQPMTDISIVSSQDLGCRSLQYTWAFDCFGTFERAVMRVGDAKDRERGSLAQMVRLLLLEAANSVFISSTDKQFEARLFDPWKRGFCCIFFFHEVLDFFLEFPPVVLCHGLSALQRSASAGLFRTACIGGKACVNVVIRASTNHYHLVLFAVSHKQRIDARLSDCTINLGDNPDRIAFVHDLIASVNPDTVGVVEARQVNKGDVLQDSRPLDADPNLLDQRPKCGLLELRAREY
ncbi:hypothetical protein KC367_g83 [Hortaea werneckii]|nr:hypothetical protein KC367_g83 [Hortaea werneckii]